jgi:predicted ester cyclase
MSNTPTGNVAVVRDLIARFFNGHNPGLAEEFFTPDLQWHGGSVGSIDGVGDYAEVMGSFFDAIPDIHATEQEVIADGDRVAMRFVVAGTHRGRLWSLEPTGSHLEWNAIMTYRFVNGKIAEQWAAEDWAAILHSVGVLTPPWLSANADEPATS